MNPESSNPSPSLAAAERNIEAHSAELKKELGLRDLVFTQIVFVVGTFWVGWAAKLGQQQSVFWILAIVTFYIPLAIAVIFLVRHKPLEGGLYQWSKLAFNDFIAFMVGWNLWVFAITILAGAGMVVTGSISYAIGAEWMKTDRMIIILISLVLIVGMTLVAIRGLEIGKWVHNAGAVVHMITFLILIALPLFALSRAVGTGYTPISLEFPTFNADNINVASKLALGALTGFEYVAIMAGESRAPAKNIGRSVMISAPIIALMFMLGTSSVLAFLPPKELELVAPIPRVLSMGFGSSGWLGVVGSIAVLGITVRTIALVSIYFTTNARLPMVAGWDRLLPAWFSRLHSKYTTPINSILFVGVVAIVLGLMSLVGAHAHEAFQIIESAGSTFYSLTYLVLFAIPLFGMKALGVKSPWWVKVACVSGFIVTLIAIGFSVKPITKVENQLSFALKIILPVVIANAIGVGIYVIRRRK